MKRQPIRVYTFGTFDGIHPGHRYYLREAKKLGDTLTVIIARDTNVLRRKGRWPELTEQERAEIVRLTGIADEVKLGSEKHPFELFRTEPINVVALGYDQWASEWTVARELKRAGRKAKIRRIGGYWPILFRTRLLKRLPIIGRLFRTTSPLRRQQV